MVDLDRWQVDPGGSVNANVSILNSRAEPVELGFAGGCLPILWTVRLAVPVEPPGREWAGIAREFKTYALTQGFGPGGVPALEPVRTEVRASPCGDANNRVFVGPGETRAWTFEWSAEIVEGVPALPALAPFTIATTYDVERQGKMMIGKELVVEGHLPIVGEGPRVVSAGEALDVLLSDPRYAAWLAQRPSTTWSNANLFLQSSPVDNGILPAGPAWEIDLFREQGVPRHFAIGFVNPFTGQLRVNYCDIPCDR
jgi:hypothetical protein